MPEVEKSFLFVCGCPRSGTTALWQLLMGSADIFLGIERFGGYMTRRNIGTLEEGLYRKDRFFNMHEGDTHYRDLAQFHAFQPYYPTAEADYDAARLIGDKIPKLYIDFDQFGTRFPNSKIIFIIRNVFDVCLSYQRRKENKSDPWSQGYEKAVQDWNQSIQSYNQFAGREFSGLVVEYEKLFDIDNPLVREAVIQQIIDFTGVSDGQKLLQTHDSLLGESRGLESDRLGDKLDSQAKRHVLLEGDIAGYRHMVESLAYPID